MLKKLFRNKKGAALVEYSLLVAGIALIGAATVATFGHKTNDMLAAVAGVIPGAHADDNNPIVSGRIIETTVGTGNGKDSSGAAADAIALDITTIAGNKNTVRLGNATGDVGSLGLLVVEPK
jgi:Flp pilus assembly pilin Flp